MKRINKQTKNKLIELAQEFLSGLDDTDKDEWYDTDRGFAEQVLSWFFSDIGIELPKEEKKS